MVGKDGEHRKGWFGGVSPGHFMSAAVSLVISLFIAFGAYKTSMAEFTTKAENNATAIERIDVVHKERLDKLETKLINRVQESENRTREDIREVRDILLKLINKRSYPTRP